MAFDPGRWFLTMTDFRVHVSKFPGRCVVTLVGELDFDTCPQVTQATDVMIMRGRTVSLDLAGVSFMDASGLGLLQCLRRRAGAEDGVLELCGLQAQPQRVLDLTGTRTHFRIVTAPGAAARLAAYPAAM
ncbi:STAS domain-containing protein [Streptomyces sp. NPDC046931]|uniref:STAS domain-containing protein n=1 Tax=Streptomyces sp. NPDC046931 TaxID=3154806 RepID=UPI0033C12D05